MLGQEKKEIKSDRIRALWDAGMQVKDIALILGIRYQFAYNVVSWHVKEKEFKEVSKLVGATRDGGAVVVHPQTGA